MTSSFSLGAAAAPADVIIASHDTRKPEYVNACSIQGNAVLHPVRGQKEKTFEIGTVYHVPSTGDVIVVENRTHMIALQKYISRSSMEYFR